MTENDDAGHSKWKWKDFTESKSTQEKSHMAEAAEEPSGHSILQRNSQVNVVIAVSYIGG